MPPARPISEHKRKINLAAWTGNPTISASFCFGRRIIVGEEMNRAINRANTRTIGAHQA
jgi:hypothetical protein